MNIENQQTRYGADAITAFDTRSPRFPVRAGRPFRWLNRTVLGIGLASLLSDTSHKTVTVLLSFFASMGAAAGALGTIKGVADGFSCIAKLYGG